MEFRLLGPVEVEGERGAVPLGSGKQRALVAVLLLHANELVSRERLIDELWGDDPPASAAHSVEVYVSRLRKALHDAGADGVLATRGSGYMLDIDEERLDVKQFQQLVEEARGADPDHASTLLRDALALWRGRPLADVELPGGARREIERLDELRLAALEDRIDADLALGRHAHVVAELQALVDEHPLRERVRAQLMLALYGAGRQADALEAYADARRALAALGLEPSAALNELQRRVLVHDPSLGTRAVAPSTPPVRRRRRTAWVAAALVLAVGAAAIAIGLTRGSSGAPAGVVPVSNSVGLFDPQTNRIVADIPIQGRPSFGYPDIAAGVGSVWVCNFDSQTVLRIDPRTRAVARTVGLAAAPLAVAVGFGAVWIETVSATSTHLVELDSLGNILKSIRLPGPSVAPLTYRGYGAVAIGAGAVWVAHGIARIAKIDPHTGTIVHDTPNLGGFAAGSIAATRDAIWVTAPSYGALVQLDPRTGRVLGSTAPAGGALASWDAIAAVHAHLWIVDSGGHLVWRVNPVTNRPDGSATVGGAPIGIAIHAGSVWVSEYFDGMIDRIDAEALRVVSRTYVGTNPSDIVAGPDGLWISFGSAQPP